MNTLSLRTHLKVRFNFCVAAGEHRSLQPNELFLWQTPLYNADKDLEGCRTALHMFCTNYL